VGSQSRGKGARGEREIATLLRRELPEGWSVERFGTGESGHDIRVTQPNGHPWPWAVEVKRYRDFSVGEVLRGPSARWLSWWRQAVEQARRSGSRPLLLTRGDRRPWWVWSWLHHGGEDGVSVEVMTADRHTVIGHRLDDVLGELAAFEDLPW